MYTPHTVANTVKQGGIKYHFLSLWYDSYLAIDERSTHKANGPVISDIIHEKYVEMQYIKEIAIGFNDKLQTSSKSPASLSDDILV